MLLCDAELLTAELNLRDPVSSLMMCVIQELSALWSSTWSMDSQPTVCIRKIFRRYTTVIQLGHFINIAV